MMTLLPDLNKLDSSAEVVHDLLIASRVPPFDGDIVFTPGIDDPKRYGFAGEFVDLGIPGLFLRGQVDVTVEAGGADVKFEPFVQVVDESMQAMVGELVRKINQRIFAFQSFDSGILFIQEGEVGIVLPDFRTTRANIRRKLVGIPFMKIPHGGGQHHKVAGRKTVFQDQFPFCVGHRPEATCVIPW